MPTGAVMRRLALAMIAAVALTTPGSTSSRDAADQASPPSSNETATTSTIALQLAAGGDSASKTFQAADPRTRTQTIEIEVTPADPAITLDFVTADEATKS